MNRPHKPKGPSQRMLRVGELVRHALASLLQRGEIIDPEIERAVITIPEVRMSPDLRLAKAYVMPLGGDNSDSIVAALNRHQRFIRGRLGPALDMKHTPEIRFFVDDTFNEASRIDALLRSENVRRDLGADDSETDEGI